MLSVQKRIDCKSNPYCQSLFPWDRMRICEGKLIPCIEQIRIHKVAFRLYMYCVLYMVYRLRQRWNKIQINRISYSNFRTDMVNYKNSFWRKEEDTLDNRIILNEENNIMFKVYWKFSSILENNKIILWNTLGNHSYTLIGKFLNFCNTRYLFSLVFLIF